MSQIFRAFKTEMIQLNRLYSSHRNIRNHYETLRIPEDASQEDIRLAFVKLSKEMHPDLSKSNNVADFIKVNEAYKTLSKKYSKYQYDMHLKDGRTPDGHRIQVVYYDPEVHYRRAPKMHDPNDPNYHFYGIKGLKRATNSAIVLLCMLLSSFVVVFQIVFIRKSMGSKEEWISSNSGNHEDIRRELQPETSVGHNEQQIAALKERLAAAEIKAKLQS